MQRIIKYHDIGKAVSEFQDNIDSTQREIRHEIISASVKDLTDEERLIIITHHKSLNYICEKISLLLFDEYYSNLYISQLQEIENKLNIEMVDIRKDVLKYKRNTKLLHNQGIIKLKGILNYCDHLASANVKKINSGINIGNKYNFDTLTTVQRQAKKEDEDIVIVAGTGSGKTEASLFWANNIDKNKDKRIFYILPFTASINAMYKRLNEDEFDVGMLHSKAQYFLYKELDNDYWKSKSQYQMYKYFTNQVTVSTIHQIFKAMFNCKFNEMMLSMYYNSIFIIDEIHCYDEKQLALILSTLKYLKHKYKIHICIMSASIPSRLLHLIQNELDIHRKLTLTKEENDKIKRHTVHYKEKYIEDDIDLIHDEYKKGNRIIIVANTVKKAQEMYSRLRTFVDKDDIVLLHSNFNQRDRERIEGQLDNKKVLVGTQTIEVSLDIDYDVMFTEISPIDSQIQRWGRINRKRPDKLKKRKNIYIYDTDSNIYNENIINKTKKLLQNIKDINENKIQDYLDEVYDEGFKDYDKYKNMCENIFNNIQVAKWDSNYNEIVSFTGASVLPECFIQEYEQYIEDKKYHDANSLLVNISEGKYKFALMKGAIDEEKGYIYYDYDEDMGLIFGKYNKFF